MSEPEQKVWYYLRAKNLKGYKFRRQFSVDHFILDFYCSELKLGIEIDGDSHFLSNEAIDYDKHRVNILQKNGIKLLRYTNLEVTDNLDSVIEDILDYLP